MLPLQQNSTLVTTGRGRSLARTGYCPAADSVQGSESKTSSPANVVNRTCACRQALAGVLNTSQIQTRSNERLRRLGHQAWSRCGRTHRHRSGVTASIITDREAHGRANHREVHVCAVSETLVRGCSTNPWEDNRG